MRKKGEGVHFHFQNTKSGNTVNLSPEAESIANATDPLFNEAIKAGKQDPQTMAYLDETIKAKLNKILLEKGIAPDLNQPPPKKPTNH